MVRALLIAALALSISAPAGAQSAELPPTKLRLYAFFATWCVPCRVELPHIQRLAETYRDRGLEVVLVSEDAPSTAANIPAFLARLDVTLDWILDDESQLLSRYNQTANVPFTALVRPDGSLAYAHPGYEPGDESLLESEIQKHLSADSRAGSSLEFRLSAQNLGVYRTSQFDPVPDNDGLLRAGVTRFEAGVFLDDFNVLARVDGAAVDDEVSGEDTDAELERLRVRDSFGPVTLTGGDDYVSIGRGVTLSLRKVDPLGLDTALRGGKAKVENERFTVTALAGVTNAQNLDPINLQIIKPESDFIAASEIEVPIGSVKISPYGLFASADEAGPGGEDVTWIVGGASASLSVAGIKAAVELASGRREGVALDRETPLAAYGSVQTTRGRHTGLFEFKAYRDWEIGRGSLLYHEPPTLEREDQEVPGNENALGARARYTLEISNSLSAFTNLLHYRYSKDGTSAKGGSNATHAYAGASGDWRELAWSGAAGYRIENDPDGDFVLDLWHVDADFSRPIARLGSRTVAASVKWNHREETKQVFSRFSFRRGLAVAGISVSGLGVLSGLYGYSTERQNDTAPTHYPGAEIAAFLPRGGTLKVFVGRLTGGRICVSGSCRDVPPFDGGRVDLVLRW